MSDLIIWIEFIVAIVILMIIARKSLWIALVISALFLGFMDLPFLEVARITYDTLTDPAVLLLSLSVALIAVIGGAMQRSGLINDLVDNTRMRRRQALVVLPGLIGMLPIPGGALLSAPVVKRAAPGLDKNVKVAINVWSRHLIVMIYPLATLLPATKMAGLDLYEMILYTIPGFLILWLLIYLFFLRQVENGRVSRGKTSAKKMAIPVLVILSAPIIHASMMYILPFILAEWFLLIGVMISLGMAFFLGGLSIREALPITRGMKAWNFGLIILGMFIFLNIFTVSNAPGVIASLPLSKALLVVFAGALLGLATGRVIVPVSVMVPIIIAKYGEDAMDPILFSVMYFSIFIGYIISPIHPCVSVSMEYFKATYTGVLRRSWVPALIAIGIALFAGIILL
ncbi:MAG: DUF401 family protein [Thermoplasmata archaeon]|nr:DUF401 family protein [Thermoplasmata archaeon]